MQYDRERVRENVRQAETEDLLDRVTVYREGMEPDALYLIEDELRQRGVTAAEIDAHARRREEAGLCDAGGMPAQCSFCTRPAVVRRWGWQRHGGRGLAFLRGLPLFPRRFWYCAVHRPGADAATTSQQPAGPRPAE
jgi:hypothetical protein